LSGFKASAEGSFFNACANTNECFKWIEEAIAASGANTKELQIFKIGVNCDADSVFNLDAKDQNKYTVEGQKGQSNAEQLGDYYIKMSCDHPLLVYLEDPFQSNDISAFQSFSLKCKEKAP